MNNREIMLKNSSIWKLLLKMSLPAMGAYLMNALYNVVDAGFIANQVNGINGLAAITAVMPIYLLIIGIASMLGVGGASLYSRYLGDGEKEKANNIVGNVIVLSIIFGVIITIIGYIFSQQICLLFGASQNIIDIAEVYLKRLLLGCIFIQLSIALTNLIRGEGNAIIAMFSMIIGSFFNIPLDYVFVVLLKKGVQGAASATVIGNFISLLFMIVYILNKSCTFKLTKSSFKLKANYIIEILSCGFASFLIQFLSIIFMTEFNIIIKSMNDSSYLAIAGVIIRITNLFNLPLLGIMNGIIPIIGYNYGAKLFSRVNETINKSILFSTSICFISFTIIMIFSKQIVGLFISDTENIYNVAVKGLRIVSILLPTAGIQIISAGIFQSLGKIKEAAISVIFKNILLIFLVGILYKMYGFYGILIAFPISDLFGFVLILMLIKLCNTSIKKNNFALSTI